MSQSHNSKDSQALLQSMLQRLKLQPGREGQGFLHTPAPTTVASTFAQDGQRGTSTFQKENNSPVNGFQFGVSDAASNSQPKGEEIQQPSQDCKVDSSPISFPSQKYKTDDETGERRVLGQATSAEITPAGIGQPFPDQSLKDADITSLEKIDGKGVSSSSSAVNKNISSNQDAFTNMVQNQVQSQGFTPKVYMWSLKPTDASVQAGSEQTRILPMENGGFGASAQSKDLQFSASSQTTANSSSRRKQQSSEDRTRRWTQKIKERWRGRQGSFVKKGKGGLNMDQKSEKVNEQLTTENVNNTSNKEEEKTLPSADSRDPDKIPTAHAKDSNPERRIRSYSDFEFSLGSFSLLEEIVTGQEWATFLNPNISATSVNQSPSDESLSHFKVPPNSYDSAPASETSNQQGGGNSQWRFWGTAATPGSNCGTAQISPDTSLPVHMEVSEGKQQASVHKEADQSEPMDDGHKQSDMQPRDRELEQQRRPPYFIQPADILDKSRAHANRKRQHQSERSIYAPSMTTSHEMEGAGGSQHDNMPLYTLNSPTPISPFSFNPLPPAPRGVLKHSISQDSESSMETMTKRRRVEEKRRVRFSEEVVSIEPLELDLDAIDSEEDSVVDDDSVIEECEVMVPAAVEEVAPARRHNLPAWILALKRKNTGRKHR